MIISQDAEEVRLDAQIGGGVMEELMSKGLQDFETLLFFFRFTAEGGAMLRSQGFDVQEVLDRHYVDGCDRLVNRHDRRVSGRRRHRGCVVGGWYNGGRNMMIHRVR